MSTQRQCESKKLHWCQRDLTEPHLPENRKSELSKSSTLPIITYQALYKFNNLTWHLATPPKTIGKAVSNRGSRRLCTLHDLSSIPFCYAVNTAAAFAAKGKHGLVVRTCTHIILCSSETGSYKNILLGFTKQNTTRFFTSLPLSFEYPHVKFVVVITFQNKHGLLKHERASMRTRPYARAGFWSALSPKQPLVSSLRRGAPGQPPAGTGTKHPWVAGRDALCSPGGLALTGMLQLLSF